MDIDTDPRGTGQRRIAVRPGVSKRWSAGLAIRIGSLFNRRRIASGLSVRCQMSKKDYLISLLSRTDLFTGLPVNDLLACAALFGEARYAKGEMLFQCGELGSRLFIVAEGRVRLSIAAEDGRELSFRHATAGEMLGEIAAFDGGQRSADAKALTPVTAYTLDRSAFHDLLSRTQISAKIIEFLCRRIRETSSQLESIALYPMEARVARFLLMALRDRTAPPGKRVPLELGFSQGELAQLLGASRPKVNAALGALESAGAINRTSDRLFCDPAKLAEFAQLGNA
jgi:CRP/FNR family cyclic AMP-dependent transcriptional regulator